MSPRPAEPERATTDLSEAAASTSKLRGWERVLSWLGSILLGWIARLVQATWRLSVVHGQEHVDAFLAHRKPVVLACWHNRLAVVGRWAIRDLLSRDVRISILVSLSRDGELLAQVARRTGFGVVRGSANRGGLRGLRGLHRAITREGTCVGTAPDGSVGPVYEAKPGTVLLAQISGAPILPVAGAARRYWRLKSWDRMIVPKPFSRLTIAVGEPLVVPEDISSEELTARTADLAARLNRLVQVADSAFR